MSTPRTDAETASVVKIAGFPITVHGGCVRADFARTLERELITAQEEVENRRRAWLEDQPDGNWIDKWGSCRVCGGEIPHGHTNNCDVFRYQRIERAAEGMEKALVEALEQLDRLGQTGIRERGQTVLAVYRQSVRETKP